MKVLIDLVFQTVVFILLVGVTAFLTYVYKWKFFVDPWSSDEDWNYDLILKASRREAYAKFKKQRRITRFLFSISYKIKYWCLLRAPFIPVKIKVSDEIISGLCWSGLATLVSKTVGKKGRLYHLRYNLWLVVQKLTPFAITYPQYYEQWVGNKLSLAFKKHRKYRDSSSVQDGGKMRNETVQKEKAKETPPTLPWKVFFGEAFLFFLTISLGLMVAFKLNKLLKIQIITLPQIPPLLLILYFSFSIILFTVLSFTRKKLKKGSKLAFIALFILAAFFAGSLALNILGIPSILSISLISVLLYVWLKTHAILIHDLIIILTIAGLGALLGLSISPLIALTLLAIFSLYDFIAVYKTKHMIRLVDETLEAQAIPALIWPRKISHLKSSLKEIKPKIKPEREIKLLILGGGDVAFPLFLICSLVPQGIQYALIVAGFSLIGLFLSFLLLCTQKIHRPMPALPPIALFSAIGFLLTRILQGVL